MKLILRFVCVGLLYFPSALIGQIAIMSQFPVPLPILAARVDTITAAGIDIDNSSISLTGYNLQFGHFVLTDTSLIPYERGIVMSTGQVTRIVGFMGPANMNDAIPPLGNLDPGDLVLDPLTSRGSKDVISLQFNFRPQSSLIVINYVLGTDEYPDSLISSADNDAYGFFVSGLNPLGGNYVNQNMAGASGIYSVFSNSGLFEDQQTGSYLNFNGVSRVLSCTLSVLPCTDYTMQIKIGDSNDEVHDSGIFIGSGQFYAIADTIPPVSAVVTYSTADTLMYEDCSTASIILTKSGSNNINNPVLVRLFAWGSATNGVDYTLVPDSVIIPAGQASVTFDISALTDNLPEGIEIAFIRYSPLCGVFDTLVLSIGDNSPLIVTTSPDTSLCGGQGPITIASHVVGGVQPINFLWDNGAGTDTIALVNPIQTTTYAFTATDQCGSSSTETVTITAGQIPTYSIVNPASSYCAGDSVGFGVSQLTPGATISWLGPNGFSSTDSLILLPNSVSSDSGAYTFTTTLNGCSGIQDTVDIVIFRSPPTPVIAASSSVCEGNSVLLSSNGTSTNSYFWTGPNGFTSSVQSPSLVSASEANEGIYSLVVSAGNCLSDSAYFSLVVNPFPIANAGLDISFLSNESGQLGVPAVSGVTYSWTPAFGLSSSTASNPMVSFPAITGTQQQFTYILSASIPGGCLTYDTVIVTVRAIPVASFIPPAAQCFVGNAFNFEASGTFNPATAGFQWNFGMLANPSTSASPNPQAIRYSQTGTFPVSLHITDNGLQSEVFYATVTVYEMPVANFTADVFQGCTPAVFSLENRSESDSQPLFYDWDFGNNRSSTEQAPKVIYANPGSYSITLIAKSPEGCADTFQVSNMFQVGLTPSSKFLANPTLLNISDPNLYITDLSGFAGPVFYTLGNGDTLAAPNGPYTYSDTGNYEITQYLGDLSACWDSSSISIRVDPGYKIYIPSAFSPNDDQINNRFRAYGEDISSYRLLIYNRWGELLYESYDLENGWDGRDLVSNNLAPGGVYVYKIDLKDKYQLNHYFIGNVMLVR